MRDGAGRRRSQCGLVYDWTGHTDRESNRARGEDLDQFCLWRNACTTSLISIPERVISGKTTIERMGEDILELVIKVASGESRTKAGLKAQNDFIPWKRGVSL